MHVQSIARHQQHRGKYHHTAAAALRYSNHYVARTYIENMDMIGLRGPRITQKKMLKQARAGDMPTYTYDLKIE